MCDHRGKLRSWELENQIILSKREMGILEGAGEEEEEEI